jgi:hypothetical protein
MGRDLIGDKEFRVKVANRLKASDPRSTLQVSKDGNQIKKTSVARSGFSAPPASDCRSLYRQGRGRGRR